MSKLYEKHGVLFAVLWIVAYCVIMTPIKGSPGWLGLPMFMALLAFSAAITIFVKKFHLEEKCGLKGWPKGTKRFLYFIPM